jgi:predicted GIY-YIG superfamily endonuclease
MESCLYRRITTKTEALKREKQLKNATGRKFIWNIINEKFGSSDG